MNHCIDGQDCSLYWECHERRLDEPCPLIPTYMDDSEIEVPELMLTEPYNMHCPRGTECVQYDLCRELGEHEVCPLLREGVI